MQGKGKGRHESGAIEGNLQLAGASDPSSHAVKLKTALMAGAGLPSGFEAAEEEVRP